MVSKVLEVVKFSAETQDEILYSNVSFQLSTGILGLCGPSGVGKSTLLLKLVNLVSQSISLRFSGDVLLNGKPLKNFLPEEFRKNVCLVPQHPVVFPGTIQENTLLGAESHKLVKFKQRPELCEELLTKVGLWKEVRYKLNEPAHSLSLGQKQRLCLARAFGVQPDFLLLDEPTASLDAASQSIVESALKVFSLTKGIVLVTHNSEQRSRMCASCIELQRGGECRIEMNVCEDGQKIQTQGVQYVS
jgi:phosphate transport system ATP-binding protein